MDSPLHVILIFTPILLVFWNVKSAAKRHLNPTRPGPPSRFVIGNLFDLPISHAWEKFTEWGRKYGGYFFLEALGRNFLIVSEYEPAVDIFDQQGWNFCDRPTLAMAGEMVGFDRTLALSHYGPSWRAQRKIIKTVLEKELAPVYERAVNYACAKFLCEIMTTPENFRSHVQLASGRIILGGTYGIPIKSSTNPLLGTARLALNVASKATRPGAYLVDFFPSLKKVPSWIPWVSFTKEAEAGRKLLDKAIGTPFDYVVNEMDSGAARQSIVSELLRNEAIDFQDHKEKVKWATGTFLGAGEGTLMTTILNFVLAMILNPTAQAKAQEEVDRVIGHDRLPNFSDIDSLPYVAAVMTEVLRWKPAVPLGLPHSNLQDATYQGHHIPKGTYSVANIWGMSRNVPDGYPADEFHPERYFDPKFSEAIDPHKYIFGFGRRKCPGSQFAVKSSFLFMASTLSTFTISAKKDVKGEPIMPNPIYSSGLTSFAGPFDCDIALRFSDKVDMLRAWEEQAEAEFALTVPT